MHSDYVDEVDEWVLSARVQETTLVQDQVPAQMQTRMVVQPPERVACYPSLMARHPNPHRHLLPRRRRHLPRCYHSKPQLLDPKPTFSHLLSQACERQPGAQPVGLAPVPYALRPVSTMQTRIDNVSRFLNSRARFRMTGAIPDVAEEKALVLLLAHLAHAGVVLQESRGRGTTMLRVHQRSRRQYG